MTHQPRHDGEVRSFVEVIAGKGAPEVVRRELRDTGPAREAREKQANGLRRHPGGRRVGRVAAVARGEHRAGLGAALYKPRREGVRGPAGERRESLLLAFASNAKRAALVAHVVHVERTQLGAA